MTQNSQTIYAKLAVTKPSTGMEYSPRLGTSGLKVSKIILGAMSYGSKDWAKWVLEEKEALPLLEHAYKAGINTWDTADVYSDGRSEEIIAKALQVYKIPRENVVILSKCRWGPSVPGEPPLPLFESYVNDGKMVNRVGLSWKHIFDAVQHSVRRLGTHIDVLQIHRMDSDVPHDEVMRALNDVVEKGWMPAWEFQMLQTIADKNGWHKFIRVQNYYNLLYREEEREVIPYCKKTGVGVIPASFTLEESYVRPAN